ncbi:MAG: host attachment protein [Paracoccaceae bacterium]
MERDVTWVLVLNATRGRILRGVDGPSKSQDTELVMRSECRNLRDALAEYPDYRRASGTGFRRMAVNEFVGSVREDARVFAREVIALLEAHRRAGDFHCLAVFATAEMQEILQAELPNTLRGNLIVESTKDLLHEPESDFRQAVLDEISRS